jgi:transposase
MLQPFAVRAVPPETVRVARAALSAENVYVKLRDGLGTLFHDEVFAHLFPRNGQPAEAPWRLAIVVILQFAEGLSDRDVASAVRSRIDWKYLLGLELSDRGFDYSILSRFRSRLIRGNGETLLLERMLSQCREAGILRERSDMRTDSTHVVAAIRDMNRLETVGETLRATINTLAGVDSLWMSKHAGSDWLARYARRFEQSRLPRTKEGSICAAEQIGADGMKLLEAIWDCGSPLYLRSIPIVETLRRCWLQEFWIEHGRVRMRRAGNLPPSHQRIDSPYDIEAHYGKKRTTEWIGYKVHFTETCAPGSPNLITNVNTTHASVSDSLSVTPIQKELAQLRLSPKRQLVDGSYFSGHLALRSEKDFGIQLVGPAKQNSHHTQVQNGYDVSAFRIDWNECYAECPQGKYSSGWWTQKTPTGRTIITTKFSRTDCGQCEVRNLCTRHGDKNPRKLTIRPQEEHELIMKYRVDQGSSAWKRLYDRRAGIEGTFSQGVRAIGLRRARYRGKSKTHLQNVAIACAINLQRLGDYWNGIPPAPTRTSAFARLGQTVM